MTTDPENARISDTMLGFEDHGIFTFSLTMDGGHWGQGFGGYGMKGVAEETITSILRALKRNRWESLAGQLVSGTGICRCGHLRMVHSLRGEKCYGIVGSPHLSREHGSPLRTGTGDCECVWYSEEQ